MTRKEFEERTGLNVSAVEFCTVNDIYMAAGEMDKDTFCKEWKKHSESKLLAELWKRVKHEHDLGMQKKEECDKLYGERWELVDFLLERAHLEREAKALKQLDAFLSLKRMVIVTYDEEGAVPLENGKLIEVSPAWKWLLE